jgi:hypothetical protein
MSTRPEQLQNLQQANMTPHLKQTPESNITPATTYRVKNATQLEKHRPRKILTRDEMLSMLYMLVSSVKILMIPLRTNKLRSSIARV